MSIGSIALTAKAESDQKLGSSKVPGLHVVTFSPDRNANLLRKNRTLFIFLLPVAKVGIGLVVLSPTSLLGQVISETKKSPSACLTSL